MKRITQSSKNSPIPLVLQSFQKPPENPPSNNSSHLIYKLPRTREIKSQPDSVNNSRQRFIIDNSNKKIQNEEISIQQHYESMEKILMSQNVNLKQQNRFLVGEIRRTLKRQDKLKEELSILAGKCQKYSQNFNSLQVEYLHAKTFIRNQVGYLVNQATTNQIMELKNAVWRFLEEITRQLRLQMNRDLPFSQQQVSRKSVREEQIKGEVDQEIELLTKKLQSLIENHQNSNKEPSVRRQCIEISKQIRRLKSKRATISNQSLNNHQSNEMLKSFQRASLPTPKDLSTAQPAMTKAIWRSNSTNMQPQQAFKYPPEGQSKITNRRRQIGLNRGSTKVEPLGEMRGEEFK